MIFLFVTLSGYDEITDLPSDILGGEYLCLLLHE
jgi:hypothetical protein